MGPAGGRYSGPAVVERSTADEMVLSFQTFAALDAALASDGAADPRTLPMHAKISGLNPMPLIPVGAMVWLSKDPAGNSTPYPLYQSAPPWQISVFDRPGGRLLFGAAEAGPYAHIVAPVVVSSVTSSCTSPNPDPCAHGSNVIYSTVDVQGDRSVTIRDSETSTVKIGGFDYDVLVTAQQTTQPAQTTCADWVAQGGVSVDVYAKDLSSLAATLDVGVLPACAEGNARAVEVSFSLSDLNFGTPYDGPVFYAGGSLFNVVGFADAGGHPSQLGVATSPGLFAKPSVGQEFWASTSAFVGALREAHKGPLLLAGGSVGSTTAAAIEGMLGVRVHAEESCAYASSDDSGVITLSDVVFDTVPPVRVRSETHDTVQISGKTYNVWTFGESGAVTFNLYP